MQKFRLGGANHAQVFLVATLVCKLLRTVCMHACNLHRQLLIESHVTVKTKKPRWIFVVSFVYQVLPLLPVLYLKKDLNLRNLTVMNLLNQVQREFVEKNSDH